MSNNKIYNRFFSILLSIDNKSCLHITEYSYSICCLYGMCIATTFNGVIVILHSQLTYTFEWEDQQPTDERNTIQTLNLYAKMNYAVWRTRRKSNMNSMSVSVYLWRWYERKGSIPPPSIRAYYIILAAHICPFSSHSRSSSSSPQCNSGQSIFMFCTLTHTHTQKEN